MLIDRRSLLKAGGLGALAAGMGSSHPAIAAPRGLLDPALVEEFPLLEVQTEAIDGGKVTYIIEGPANGPLALYFHGWGDDYRTVLPLEYGLVEAGFRLLLAHRPGYAGTALEGKIGKQSLSWEGPAATADLNARLLDRLYGPGKWNVAVVAMSGGSPAALAFASRYPAQTRALMLQAGVTQAFFDAKYVPELLRGDYKIAFEKFGWTGDQVSQILFGLLLKLRENFITDEDVVKALTGERLADAKEDPAFKAAISRMLHEDPANSNGEWSDFRYTFFSKTPYCQWERITAPTLLIHDEKDAFVPIVHAEEAKAQLKHATLRKFAVAGHIVWLGREARLMHEARVEFLRRYS